MTLAARIVGVLLEEEGSAQFDDNDLRDVVNSGFVTSWLNSIGEEDIREKSFRFEVRVDEKEDIDRELSCVELRRLGRDTIKLENNVIEIMDRNGVAARDEGHTKENYLIGSCWMRSLPDKLTGRNYWLPQLKALAMVLAGSSKPLTGEKLSQFDKRNFLYDGVTELGRQALIVSLRFFDTEPLKLERWEEIFRIRPQLWPVRNDVSEKQMLDFNQTVGTKEPHGIFMTRVDGTPIFSAKCPGCKSIHGNFRTWEQASGSRMCRGCVADFVDISRKANETGNLKPLLKKRHK